MVDGGLDAISTTFAVVSGVAGAELGANVILILGIGNLLADGLGAAKFCVTRLKPLRSGLEMLLVGALRRCSRTPSG